MKKVAVLGGGAWGTAIATVLAHNGHAVTLWCLEQSVVDDIQKTGINGAYLPGVSLHTGIKPTTSLQDALQDVQWVFEAIPVKYMRTVLEQCRSFYKTEQRWVVLSKGIEQETLLLPTQIIADVFQTEVATAVVAGPSFAHELAMQELTAVNIASESASISVELQELLKTLYLHTIIIDDVIGMEICAAFKNVIALGVGMLEGMGSGDNTKAFFLVKSCQDLERLLAFFLGKQSTIYSYAGIGDLVLTAYGAWGRNRMMGRKIGERASIAHLHAAGTVEGFNTVRSLYQLMQAGQLELPLCKAMYQILYESEQLVKLKTILVS